MNNLSTRIILINQYFRLFFNFYTPPNSNICIHQFSRQILIIYVLNILSYLKLLSLIKLFHLKWCNFLFVYTNSTWLVILNNCTRDLNLSYTFKNGKILLYIFPSVRFDNSCFEGTKVQAGVHVTLLQNGNENAQQSPNLQCLLEQSFIIVYICWS